ncbi:hypothetical protein GLOTRDRAFT_91994 [Gloeophyllum trabeum ATCC 11539]|uniref:Uncharacterized protein n=1 Tax=Gloeophyllum trabeum (strain ATCC 11539 / FP-39264 / Madison 617) TaxID=670483 RepID=S7RV48_GLOTA|nr:uncharacterized protein GLOTRDRAFT_91994 [Gloeophyllum trabeum ATCC 11539]EPQ58645.1 hypothetical protein GLOTRDRAFT_91994 [Gloeophyllum trabeum ATCC 11539]
MSQVDMILPVSYFTDSPAHCAQSSAWKTQRTAGTAAPPSSPPGIASQDNPGRMGRCTRRLSSSSLPDFILTVLIASSGGGTFSSSAQGPDARRFATPCYTLPFDASWPAIPPVASLALSKKDRSHIKPDMIRGHESYRALIPHPALFSGGLHCLDAYLTLAVYLTARAAGSLPLLPLSPPRSWPWPYRTEDRRRGFTGSQTVRLLYMRALGAPRLMLSRTVFLDVDQVWPSRESSDPPDGPRFLKSLAFWQGSGEWHVITQVGMQGPEALGGYRMGWSAVLPVTCQEKVESLRASKTSDRISATLRGETQRSTGRLQLGIPVMRGDGERSHLGMYLNIPRAPWHCNTL